jgi:hypothetical protein
MSMPKNTPDAVQATFFEHPDILLNDVTLAWMIDYDIVNKHNEGSTILATKVFESRVQEV